MNIRLLTLSRGQLRQLILVFLLLIPTALSAQLQTFTGLVRSAQGEALRGVTVRLLGTQRGAVTDASGHFTLSASIGDSIQVSSVGMVTRRLRLSQPRLTIILHEDSRLVDEVVVTGYQKIRSRVYTGAATSVKMKDIHQEGTQDITRMLEGRVPGLSVQSVSGTFGTAPRLNIRGGASILGNVQPLWVIDGAVYEDLVHLSLDHCRLHPDLRRLVDD